MAEQKAETQSLKAEMQGLKTETQSLKSEMQGLKTETQGLKERMTNVELLLENYVVPSLKDLCKVVNTEYRRYEISIESHEQMKTDTDVLKSVVSDHSERIIRLEKDEWLVIGWLTIGNSLKRGRRDLQSISQ